MRVAFLFPGQGAQIVGMGQDFYTQFSEAKEIFDQADQYLGFALSEIMFQGPEEHLLQTEQCQLALFVHSMAILAVLKKKYPTLVPEVCAGLSLGELSAICASGRISYQDMLFLVRTRALAMQHACETTQGTMAAILGLEADEVDEVVMQMKRSDLWVANYNCPGQVVVSGSLEGVAACMQFVKSRAKRVIPLKVAGAFHSGLMNKAVFPFSQAVAKMRFSPGTSRLVMNSPGNFVEDEKEISKYLVEQLVGSLRWQQGIEAMRGKIDLFLELGAGKTLTQMNRQMKVGEAISIAKVEDLEKLESV